MEMEVCNEEILNNEICQKEIKKIRKLHMDGVISIEECDRKIEDYLKAVNIRKKKEEASILSYIILGTGLLLIIFSLLNYKWILDLTTNKNKLIADKGHYTSERRKDNESDIYDAYDYKLYSSYKAISDRYNELAEISENPTEINNNILEIKNNLNATEIMNNSLKNEISYEYYNEGKSFIDDTKYGYEAYVDEVNNNPIDYSKSLVHMNYRTMLIGKEMLSYSDDKDKKHLNQIESLQNEFKEFDKIFLRNRFDLLEKSGYNIDQIWDMNKDLLEDRINR